MDRGQETAGGTASVVKLLAALQTHLGTPKHIIPESLLNPALALSCDRVTPKDGYIPIRSRAEDIYEQRYPKPAAPRAKAEADHRAALSTHVFELRVARQFEAANKLEGLLEKTASVEGMDAPLKLLWLLADRTGQPPQGREHMATVKPRLGPSFDVFPSEEYLFGDKTEAPRLSDVGHCEYWIYSTL